MGRFSKQRRQSSWRKLALHAWSRPSDPTVYGVLEVDVGPARAYLARLRAEHGVHVTLTHLVGKAVALAIRERPEVNAVVRRRHQVYLRDTIDVFFQVAVDGGEDLSGAKITRVDERSVVQIAQALDERVARLRAHRDPVVQRTQAMLDRAPGPVRGVLMRAAEALTYDLGLDLRRLGIPFDSFGSVMVTNVGVFGLPLGFAPLVPFARTPMLLTVGTVKDTPVARGGEVVVRPILPIGATFDHRLLDGFEAGRLAERFVAVMSDPESALGD